VRNLERKRGMRNERESEWENVRKSGQMDKRASVSGPSRSAPRMPQLVHISTGSDGERLHSTLTDPILFSHTHTKSSS